MPVGRCVSRTPSRSCHVLPAGPARTEVSTLTSASFSSISSISSARDRRDAREEVCRRCAASKGRCGRGVNPTSAFNRP